MKFCVNSAVMSSQAKYFLLLSRLIPFFLLFLSRHLAQELRVTHENCLLAPFNYWNKYVVLALENWSKQSFTVYSDAPLFGFFPKWRTKN